ncbi:MAG: hypothetical protein Gaeavirus9_9 [Gaeavirus sp.]|uniref:Uncharacterized protein n=1 Tax=Gaeavirus sp. TaxID=2487767 RepID=A0A3G5A3R8_9VIRU|nr:MAG: hypothetical protein Gaeavirus9_9 [Gaeavirus sp.]
MFSIINTDTAIIEDNNIDSYGLISNINLNNKNTTSKIITTFE